MEMVIMMTRATSTRHSTEGFTAPILMGWFSSRQPFQGTILVGQSELNTLRLYFGDKPHFTEMLTA